MTHNHAHPTPHEVVTAAITAPLGCAACGRVDQCRCLPEARYGDQVRRRVDVIVAALREHGHLPPAEPPSGPTLAEVHETAQWLAERSRHPRYAGEGWHRIMQSEADVAVAHAQAAREATNDDLADLNAAKRLLDRWRDTYGPEAPR